MRTIVLALLLLALMLNACAAAPLPGAAATEPATSLPQAPTLLPTRSPITPTPQATLAPTALPTEAPTRVAATAAPTAILTAIPTATPVTAGSLSLVRGALASRPYTVMIDNHPNAYPQVGLDGAVLVFEALAEFGITRYMAVFVPGTSPSLENIGPVRSARPYFVEWAKGLNGVYAHAGGSPEGLLLAETAIEVVNMDALRSDAGKFFRRSSQRSAPHNLYTSSAEIAAFLQQKGSPEANYSEIGFLFKADLPFAERPASQQFSYFFIYKEQSVGWVYDAQANDYLRYRGSRPYLDARSGEQLRFKNIIVLEVPEAPIPGDAKGRIEQQVVGQGAGRLFIDGSQQEIRWQKDAGYAQLRMYLPTGEEIALNPGSTWIAAVPSLANLTVQGGR